MSQQIPKVEFITERASLEAGREQTVELIVRITAPKIEREIKARPPLNFSVALDRSGSMEGEKIRQAREAVKYCIEQFLPTDRFSLVIFDDAIDVLIPSQLVQNKNAMKATVSEVAARGMTNLHEAWVKSGLQVSEHLNPQAINRVLLVTDGLANQGLTNPDIIVTQAKELAARGVSASTIGIGDDFNEDLLGAMAQAADGNAWHVEGPDDMQRIFAVELEGLLAQFAHTVTLGFIPADGVRITDVLNDFEQNEAGRYRLPNLQMDEPLDVVVRLRVPAQSSWTTLRLLDVKLGYTMPDKATAEVLKSHLEIDFISPERFERLPVNTEVTQGVQLMMNARARKEAIKQMDAGDFAGARGTLAAAYEATSSLPSDCLQNVQPEMEVLLKAASSMEDRSQAKISRKRLFFGAFSRQRGQDKK
jgi:Ca-activated chloride channel family protein